MCLEENAEAIQGSEMAPRETAGGENIGNLKEMLCMKAIKDLKCRKQLKEATDVQSDFSE